MPLDLSADKPINNVTSDAGAITDAFTKIETNVNALPISQLAGYPSDVTKFLRGDGTWTPVSTVPGSELDYAQTTGNVTVSSHVEGTPTVVVTGNSITCDGTAILIECFAPIVQGTATATDQVIVNLWEDSTNLGRVFTSDQGYANQSNQLRGVLRRTPAAGAHVYKVQAWVAGANSGTIQCGSGGAGANVPAFLRVTKV